VKALDFILTEDEDVYTVMQREALEHYRKSETIELCLNTINHIVDNFK